MQETFKGPELRDWCQNVGLLETGRDFADRSGRGRQISVQTARTFIINYFRGKAVDPRNFETTDTTPLLSPSGTDDQLWETMRAKTPNLWNDTGLKEAAIEYVKLIKAQRAAFPKGIKVPVDYPEKTSNAAIMSAWAYTAGMLHNNQIRLKRHFELSETKGRDPLNAAALVKGRHKTDVPNYRGLGYRTDSRERGRFVELFFLQAEDGKLITKNSIDVAVAKHHAKLALLDVQKAQARG